MKILSILREQTDTFDDPVDPNGSMTSKQRLAYFKDLARKLLLQLDFAYKKERKMNAKYDIEHSVLSTAVTSHFRCDLPASWSGFCYLPTKYYHIKDKILAECTYLYNVIQLIRREHDLVEREIDNLKTRIKTEQHIKKATALKTFDYTTSIPDKIFTGRSYVANPYITGTKGKFAGDPESFKFLNFESRREYDRITKVLVRNNIAPFDRCFSGEKLVRVEAKQYYTSTLTELVMIGARGKLVWVTKYLSGKKPIFSGLYINGQMYNISYILSLPFQKQNDMLQSLPWDTLK